jgi:hypothetical protein
MRVKALVLAICIASISIANADDKNVKPSKNTSAKTTQTQSVADLSDLTKLDQFSVEFVEDNNQRINDPSSEELVNIASSSVVDNNSESENVVVAQTEEQTEQQSELVEVALENKEDSNAVEIADNSVSSAVDDSAKSESIADDLSETNVPENKTTEVAIVKEDNTAKAEDVLAASNQKNSTNENIAKVDEATSNPETLTQVGVATTQVSDSMVIDTPNSDLKPKEITEEMLYSADLDSLFPLPKKTSTVDMKVNAGVYIVSEGYGTDKLVRDMLPSNAKKLGITRGMLIAAIYRKNPECFGDKGPLYPYAKAKLNIPTVDQILLESDTTYANYLGKKGSVITLKNMPALKQSNDYDKKLADVLAKRKAYLETKIKN